ncbi:MAG: polyprenyl synthetase family protein [Candidatus Bathyarchaeia archaeon]|jgi:geranylgeranyl pyrophosphate synthase
MSRKILEDNGAKVADKAKMILLEDPALKELREPLQFISENWRDITPALISLSCEAVGGKTEETYDVALAMCLMNLGFTTWDDIIDNAQSKTFKPTLFGKFGQGITIIVGGIASAKGFTILNDSKIENGKRKKIVKLIWKLWSKMATVETSTLRMRTQGTLSSNKKFWKIKSEALDLGTCLKIGAIIGNGSNNEINHLGKYGEYLGIILALQQDFQVSVNLTLELAEKIRNNRLPYSIIWASEHSKPFKLELETLKQKSVIDDVSIKEFIKLFLDTAIIYNIENKIKKYKKLAEKELNYRAATNASQSLKSFLNIQSRTFHHEFPSK